MKKTLLFIVVGMIIVLQGCKKLEPGPQFAVPNGDFESWTSGDYLQNWTSNSCPACVPPFETYIVQKTTEAYHGQYAASLIYNGVYPAYINNKFAVDGHPSALLGYEKCQLYGDDTVSVRVLVYYGNAVVDSGKWLNTTSTADYKPFSISLTQSSAHADSVLVLIKGGNKMDSSHNGSVLWVDYLSLR